MTWSFLAIMSAICLALYLNGMRFARMDENPLARRRPFGLRPQGSSLSAAGVRRAGLAFKIGAVVVWLFALAVFFGLLGHGHRHAPVQNQRASPIGNTP